ncbi:MAG: hypothetical protein ABSH20_16225 [Tepidisphaeraceae bacterium]|jgi:hypothetical protein
MATEQEQNVAKLPPTQPEPNIVKLPQKLDVRKIGDSQWRVTCLIGRTIIFYGETGAGAPPFTVNNEFTQADVGKWRAVDRGRHLVVGFGGKVAVAPKEGGQPNEVQVNFDGIAMAL